MITPIIAYFFAYNNVGNLDWNSTELQ